MKAKTTWLIGLLIALMMVVTAVPAFAKEEQQPVDNANQDVNVEAQTDGPDTISVNSFTTNARVYIGQKIAFDVNIWKTSQAPGNIPYDIKIVDATPEATAATPTMSRIDDITYPIDTMPEGNKVTIESSPVLDNPSLTILGKHTFKIYGKKRNESEYTDLNKSISTTVMPALSAYQTAHDSGDSTTLTGEIGKPVTLSAFAKDGYGSGYYYEWQKSKTGASPEDIDNDAWTKIATGDAAQYTMQYGDKYQYIRCVVSDGDGNQLVAPVDSASGTTLVVQLNATSTGTITIKKPEQDSTVTLVEGQTFSPTPIEAEGGTSPTPNYYNFQWKKGNEDAAGGSAKTASYSKANVTKDDEGLYKCVVTDKTDSKITATSKTTRLIVKSAPKFSIDTNKGTTKVDQVGTWAGSGATPVADAEGTVSISSADAAKGLTLSLNLTGDLNDPARTIAWSGAGITPKEAANKTSVTIPAGSVTAENYMVTVAYPTYGLLEETYTLTVVLTGGSITATDGGIYKQAGSAAPTKNPKYTISLPTDTAFDNVTTGTDIASWLNEPDGLIPRISEVKTNSLTFQFTGQSSDFPYVKDLEVTVPADYVEGSDVPIVFPVSSDYGFQVTDTLTADDITIDNPGDTNENVYDGNAIAAKIVKNAGDPDIGTVSNIRYLEANEYDSTKPVDENLKKATTSVKDAGTYRVWCNVGKSTAYPDGASNLLLDETFTINPATDSTMDAKAEGKGYDTYFTWTKSKKKTGSKLDADVAFKSGLTNKGKITSIVYKKDGKDGVQINPVDVGKYTIEVTIANDGEKNPASNVVEGTYHIGTFEITDKDPVPETKKDPTKDLYEMSPTSATADGKAHTTTVSIKDEYSDAGEVTATKYYDSNNKRISGNPTKVGEYTVKIDTEETDTYKAAKDLEIGKFTIKGATPTASMYTMTPKSGSSVTANGKGQGVTVKADDPKVAGEPTVKYYDKDGKAVSGQPVKAGKYTVRIDTAASDYYAAGKDIAMGTFEITQGTPTKAMNLYKLDPATNPYTGKANPTKVVPAGDNGAGEVEAIHYTRKTTKVKESDEGPVAIGVYTVTVDAKASDSFKAVKGLEVGEYEIIDQGIFLRAHVENLGWDKTMTELEPGVEKTVGTEGRALRVEAIDIAVPAGYSIEGFAHIQNLADTNCVVLNGSEADYPAGVPAGYTVYRFGSTGRGLRMEAMQINLKDASGTTMSQLKYCVHVENDGWHAFVNNGSFAGTRGRGLRLEALRFAYAR